MRKTISLLIILISILGLVSAQEDTGNNLSSQEYYDDPVCGDSECHPQEEGVCPEDCDPDSVPEQDNEIETDNERTQTSEQEESIQTQNDTEEVEETEEDSGVDKGLLAIAGASFLMLVIGGLAIFMLNRNNDESGNQEYGDLSGWIERQQKKGYNMQQIRSFMEQRGVSSKKINEAISEADIDQNTF